MAAAVTAVTAQAVGGEQFAALSKEKVLNAAASRRRGSGRY